MFFRNVHTACLIAVAVLVALSCDYPANNLNVVKYDAEYEQKLQGFVVSTGHAGQENSAKRLDSILTVAYTDSLLFHKTTEFLEKSLGGVASPYRNDQLYSQVLQKRIQSAWYSLPEKQVAENRLKLINQNKEGDLANDFVYLTPAGYKKRMYDIHSDFIILFFYNPECPACKEMKQAISQSDIISKKIKEKSLTLLAIYTDKDETVWLNHLKEIPDRWIDGRDENEYLYTNNIYDLRAIPTVYLLDKEKRVVLKDCLDVKLIESAIGSRQSAVIGNR